MLSLWFINIVRSQGGGLGKVITDCPVIVLFTYLAKCYDKTKIEYQQNYTQINGTDSNGGG